MLRVQGLWSVGGSRSACWGLWTQLGLKDSVLGFKDCVEGSRTPLGLQDSLLKVQGQSVGIQGVP